MLARQFYVAFKNGIYAKKPAFRYVFIDAMICASIAGVAVPVCTHIFGHADFSAFGTMIGFIGTGKNTRILV